VRELDRAMWRLAVPSMTENLLILTLILVDTFMIALWGGKTAVAATAAAGHILWRVYMTFGCVDRGTTAIVARYIGEGRPDKASQALGQSLLMAGALGLVITACGWLAAPWLLSLLGTPPEVSREATPYLQVLFLGTVPRLMAAVASAAVRAAGDTKTPMFVSLAMNAIHVGLNAILIFGIPAFPALGFVGWSGWGLVGCAIGTTLSHVFALSMLLGVLGQGRLQIGISWIHTRPHWTMQRNLARISMPAVAEETVMTVGFTAFFAFVTHMGTEAVAAHTISTRVEALAFMPAFGFSVAAATLVGQSLGMADPRRATMAMRRCAWACTGFMTLAGAVLIVFGEIVIRLFLANDPDVEILARMLLIMAAVQQPMMGLVMILGGGLRGAGDTFRPMVSSLLGNLIVRVGLCYLLAFPLGLGIFGIYLAMMCDWTVRSLVLTVFVQRGDWVRTRVE
jgi:putative MATE family efflux protein